MTIRVLIADDQDIIRTGLATILGSQPDIDVIGQAADGHEAVALARRLRPDVCLLDIRMPHLDGVEATRILAGPNVQEPRGRRHHHLRHRCLHLRRPQSRRQGLPPQGRRTRPSPPSHPRRRRR